MSNTKKKKLKDLTLKDNFMFGAVMMEEENCKDFLELALGISVDHVEVSREKSIVYHPDYRGVRLDVYAKDEDNTRYNVEMQRAKKAELGKRDRYYHSQIDMELLLSGSEYKNLPKVYVIFVCDFDPFGKKKYRYSFLRKYVEDEDAELGDESISIFLSIKGENDEEVQKELVKFLNFVKADLSESEADFDGCFVKKLQETIRRVKSSRELEERFMIFEEMLQEEYAEGKAEGMAASVLNLLEDLGEISDVIRDRVMAETDFDVLIRWLKQAAKVETVEEFLEKM